MGAGCHRKDKRSFRAMRGSWSRTSSARGDIMQTSVSEATVPARRPQPDGSSRNYATRRHIARRTTERKKEDRFASLFEELLEGMNVSSHVPIRAYGFT
jgi:hypothetical protein